MKITKQDKLLEYLASEGERWISSSILSEYLSVSTRQIRKYINMINEEAAKPIILSSNRGYMIDMKAFQEYRLHKITDDDDSPLTRQNYTIFFTNQLLNNIILSG